MIIFRTLPLPFGLAMSAILIKRLAVALLGPLLFTLSPLLLLYSLIAAGVKDSIYAMASG